MDAVARGIISTLVYFDLQEYPLTREEVWRWWYGPRESVPQQPVVNRALDALRKAGRVIETGGFVHLPNRQALVALRLERRKENERKWRRAKRAAWFLRYVPFVRLLAVCNTVAISNGRPDSDIDVFLVVRQGRLWLTRLLVTVVVSLLGLRRHGSKIANRICLSFFVTEAALDFRPLLLQPQDPYFAFWVDQLVPLMDIGSQLSAIHRQNPWVKNYLPNAFTTHQSPVTSHSVFQRGCEHLLRGAFGDVLESLARKFQKTKMAATARTSPSRRVVITDDLLKFHEEDRRELYRSRFVERLNQVLGSLS